MQTPSGYCISRFQSRRRVTRVVPVGHVPVGGQHRIAIQSMTTTLTQNVAATVRQVRALVDAGCDIVRITAPHLKAAQALKEIRAQLDADKIAVPLVADIHFLPSAAMEAVNHVEKVRVNPGNYADKKKFAIREYTDSQYEEELQRLYESFSPLVLRAKELGRTLRIGTNHGSLSDRIMNRYGDSPEGMVQSALEFVRIAESHGFQDIILSLKASNPKVMIAAYRLAAARMAEEGMNYPLHLGVTEAGDGEDGRIKSAVGIGSLLMDGLGDTIRVSLTEDPVYEIPVAQALAEKAMTLWKQNERPQSHTPTASSSIDRIDVSNLPVSDDIHAFDYQRRTASTVSLTNQIQAGDQKPPLVWLALSDNPSAEEWSGLTRFKDTPVEGWVFRYQHEQSLQQFLEFRSALPAPLANVPGIADLASGASLPDPETAAALSKEQSIYWVCSTENQTESTIRTWLQSCLNDQQILILDTDGEWVRNHALLLHKVDPASLIFTCTTPHADYHHVGAYRDLAQALHEIHCPSPLWIRNHPALTIQPDNHFQSRLLEASFLTGALLCDGLGDIVSIETEPLPAKALTLGYNLLQAARARISKTEFVACPSCGRTLFDLQSTTQRIREKTGHLKGVTIAVMGCIVNGPGEMADADFGYVGGAPKKVNLYVGKECVEYHVPEEEADARLIQLIQKHGKWVDPEPQPLTV